MKIHNFTCFAGHEFQGWYKTTQECRDNLSAGCISCPVCGSVRVRQLGEPRPLELEASDLNSSDKALVPDQQAAEILSSLISSAKETAKQQYLLRKQWNLAGNRDEVTLFRRIGVNAGPDKRHTHKQH